jgi:hypothetical protein
MNTDDIITDSPQNKLEKAWLVGHCPESALLDALSRLGNRRSYPLNLAVILGCKTRMKADVAARMAEDVALPSPERRRKYITNLRTLLNI